MLTSTSDCTLSSEPLLKPLKLGSAEGVPRLIRGNTLGAPKEAWYKYKGGLVGVQ